MSKESVLEFDRIVEELESLSPTTLDHLLASTPWQGNPAGSLSLSTDTPVVDEDGFSLNGVGLSDDNYANFAQIQRVSWNAFKSNPFVFTTILDTTGRLTGKGFSMSNVYPRADEFMEEVWDDPRNNLVLNFGKYIARATIQGELFLPMTLHTDGFVEVDFLSPSVVKGFDDGSGILMAEGKPMFPLMYRVESTDLINSVKFIPSINLAYYPELWAQALAHKDVDKAKIVGYDKHAKFKELNNYKTYMVQWDQGFVTKRNVGRVRVSLEWLEHYTNLKNYEIDHKKSSGAYLWTIEIEDRQAFRMWLAMSDDEREQTGLLKKKVPGGTLMLPPGFKMTCHNPKLSSITNQDTDILKMISAGLNIPEDVMTGSSSGTTFSGAKLSRGPVADRIQDQAVGLERWLMHGFWRGALWLHSKATGMPWRYKLRKAYKFEDGEPKFKNVQVESHKLVSVNFPVTEMGDMEGKAKSMLGVQHGPLTEILGLPKAEVAAVLGFQNYNKSRLETATEEEIYPDLPLSFEIAAAAVSSPMEPTEAPPKPAVSEENPSGDENELDNNAVK